MPPTVATPPAPAINARVAAYCAPDGPEVFSGIVHGNQIWTPDRFDVDAVHPEARAAFHRLLARASDADLPLHGNSLLLLGEAGSGKTPDAPPAPKNAKGIGATGAGVATAAGTAESVVPAMFAAGPGIAREEG